MNASLRLLQIFCYLVIVSVHGQYIKLNTTSTDREFYQKLLTDIRREQSFENILLIHDSYPPKDDILELIYQYPVPKVILNGDTKMFYKKLFNTEMLVVLIINEKLNVEMFETMAVNLNYIRQTRILILGVNVQHSSAFKDDLRLLCHCHKMTNVLLHFLDTTTANAELSRKYHMLQPYPEYHWEVHYMHDNHTKLVYYPTHWLNMHNTTLVTLTDQREPRTLVFKDSQGQIRINGYIANMIFLFGERFNATLRMHSAFKFGKTMHFTKVNQLVIENKVDLPMVLEAGGDDRWQNMSHAYDIGETVLMVPLAQPFTISQIFTLLLNGSFFKYIIICSLIFSVVHSLLVYLAYGKLQPFTFIVDSTAFPGVLGSSFVSLNPAPKSLKIVYLLIGLVGINISSLFAGLMNTYFTSPPYHPQIYTYDDLQHSNIKMLLSAADSALMVGWFKGMERSLINCTNVTYVLENRNNFNTSYAYFTVTPVWKMLLRQQQFHSRKSFHIPEPVKFITMLPWGFMLPFNSPHKEPLNNLLLRVHAFGLIEAWDRSTFSDMLKLKKISLRDPNPPKDRKAFSANDFFWVWMILVMGLGVSSVVYVGEVLWFKNKLKLKIGI